MAHIVMQEMHSITLSIDTGSSSSEVWSEVKQGIDNLQEQLNETVQQYKFMADEGFGRSRVTGMAPVWTLSGRRIWGDDAQDYVFDKDRKYGLGANRETKAKVAYTAGGSTYTITFDCTICNVQELSGATEEDSAISFEIHVDGKPTVTVS